MRRRLLVSTIAVAVTAVLLFGLPLAFVLRQLQVSVAQDQVQRDATTVARTLQNRSRSSVVTNPSDYAAVARSLPDAYVSISQNGDPPYRVGQLPPRGSAIVAHAATANFHVTVAADRSVENAGVSEKLA